MMTPQVEKAAGVAAGVSIPAMLTGWAANALPVLQMIATVVAIVAGLFAIAVHWRKLRAP
jgi:hypothetical protein